MESIIVMVNHLVEDLKIASQFDSTSTAAALAICGSNPPRRRFARRYGPVFVQKIIVVKTDLTSSLARRHLTAWPGEWQCCACLSQFRLWGSSRTWACKMTGGRIWRS